MRNDYDMALEDESRQAYDDEQERQNDFQQHVIDPALRQIIQNKLTRRQQECVALVYFENLSQRKAARILGISQSAVHQHLRLAMKKMHTILRYCQNTAQNSRHFFNAPY